MSAENKIKIHPRDGELSKKWQKKSDRIPVNNQQYSFDSPERIEEFTKSLFETKEELERYNEYRSEWYRRAKEFDPGEAPLAVCCELVSNCNLNCPMCYTITEEFQASAVGSQRVLPWNIVKNVIDECAVLGVPSMLFSWRGESTMYRSRDEDGNEVRFPDVLAYARKKGILEITSLTNGQMIDDEMARAIVDAEPSWISISIDGLEENYRKIRTPANKKGNDYNAFQKVLRSIEVLVSYRDKLGKKRPQIRANTIYPPIAKDPMAYYQFMKDIGVGWVTINEILDFRGENLPEEAVLKNWACQYPFQRLTVSANGCVIPCTGAHNEEDEMVLGRYPGTRPKEITVNKMKEVLSYPEKTLKDAWHSDKLKKIRLLQKENRRVDILACKNCRHGTVKHGAEWIPEGWNMETMEWGDGIWRE